MCLPRQEKINKSLKTNRAFTHILQKLFVHSEAFGVSGKEFINST
jgi:hypothetical protein